MASKKGHPVTLAPREAFTRLNQLRLSPEEKLAVLVRLLADVLVVDYDGDPAAAQRFLDALSMDKNLRAAATLFAESERSSARIKAGAKS